MLILAILQTCLICKHPTSKKLNHNPMNYRLILKTTQVIMIIIQNNNIYKNEIYIRNNKLAICLERYIDSLML